MSNDQTSGGLSPDDLQKYRDAFEAVKNAKAATCPHCGACQHCGRGGYVPTYPVYPQPCYQPYPWYQPQVTYTTTPTISAPTTPFIGTVC